jgi:hypothetical protein
LTASQHLSAVAAAVNAILYCSQCLIGFVCFILSHSWQNITLALYFNQAQSLFPPPPLSLSHTHTHTHIHTDLVLSFLFIAIDEQSKLSDVEDGQQGDQEEEEMLQTGTNAGGDSNWNIHRNMGSSIYLLESPRVRKELVPLR